MSRPRATPDPPALVPAGSNQRFRTAPTRFLNDLHDRYGDVVAVRLDGKPTVVFGGRHGPATLFRGEREHLEVHNTELVRDLFGRAIFNLRSYRHRQARTLLRAGLSGPALHAYAPTVARLAETHVRGWATAPVDLYEAVRALTTNICTDVVIGLSTNDPDRPRFPRLLDQFSTAATVSPSTRYRTATYWTGRCAAAHLRAAFRRTMVKATYEDKPSLLCSLTRSAQSLGVDPAALPDHLLALLIATRETTASLLTWLLAELSAIPDATDRLAADIDLLHRDPAAALDPLATPTMAAVLRETQRLHSPNTISRRIVTTDWDVHGHRIPAGWNAAYSPSANHLRPDLVEDPHIFLPTRYADVLGARRSALLLTFGGGIHACPGRSLADMIARQVAAAVFGHHRLYLPHGVPSGCRYLPVKAPTSPVPAVLLARSAT